MKKVFLYISIGITLLAIPATVFLVGRNQEIRKRAAPASTLSIVPATATKRVGETFTLEVKLDTAENQVMTVQLAVLYDPAKLITEEITNGPFAPTIRVSGQANANGSASITVGARDSATPISGSGIVARITMRALSAGSTPATVRFSPHPDTQANALNESANIIIGLTGANITVLNEDGTAGTDSAPGLSSSNTATDSGITVTPTPTSVLTPTPTTIPTSTGGAQASGSALLISSPIADTETTSTMPQIRGKGTPGTTITVIIHSDPITGTVTVDAYGNWVFTPTTPLSPGTHTVEAMYTDPNTGQTQTQTISFVVAGEETTTEVSTGSAVPVSGSVGTTLLLISLSCILFISGLLVPVYLR